MADMWSLGMYVEFREVSGVSGGVWRSGRYVEFREVSGV